MHATSINLEYSFNNTTPKMQNSERLPTHCKDEEHMITRLQNHGCEFATIHQRAPWVDPDRSNSGFTSHYSPKKPTPFGWII